MKRISIATVLGIVAVVAFGLAALINATELWAGVTFTFVVAMLLGSVVGLILRGWRRGGWLGFAIFGWTFFLVSNLPVTILGTYPAILPDCVADAIFSKANVRPVEPTNPHLVVDPTTGNVRPEVEAYNKAYRAYQNRYGHSLMIGRWFWILLLAGFGSILGSFLARSWQEVPRPDLTESSPVSSHGP